MGKRRQQGHVPEAQQEAKGKSAAKAAVGSGASIVKVQAGSSSLQRSLKGTWVSLEAQLTLMEDTRHRAPGCHTQHRHTALPPGS